MVSSGPWAIMGAMSVSATKIERSGPAVRAALAELAPEECARFEAEFRSALAASRDDFDGQRVQDVIGRWWARANVLLAPDPIAEATWGRIKAGDTTDLVSEWRPQDDGSQHVYRRADDGPWGFSHVLHRQGA